MRLPTAIDKRDTFSVMPLSLPSLGCPFPVHVSLAEPLLEQRSLTWGPTHGIITGVDGERWLRTAQFGSLAARVCADFDTDALTDAVDWLVWLFAFDDRFCEAAGAATGMPVLTSTLVRFLRVMTDPAEARDEPFELALADLWRRTARRATDQQMQRLRGSVDGYFVSLVWEACHGASDVTLDEYRFMRPYTAGVPLWLMLVEIMGGHRPDAEVMVSPAMNAVHERAAHVINWENDILSFRRESTADPDSLNLATVLQITGDRPPQEALDVAASMHAEEVTQYQRAEAEVLRHASPSVDAYVQSLRNVISGFHAWFIATGRYA
jgi:Terpene synthase family 2, C-terminal metal binding